MKKKTKIILIIVVVLVAGTIAGGAVWKIKNAPKPYAFTTVQKTNIVQEVSVTGKVKPIEEAKLSFEKSGQIDQIYARVGDTVKTGQILMSLDVSSLQAQMRESQAQLAKERADLATLKLGAKPEEIELAQAAVNNSQVSLEDAKRNLDNTQSKAMVDIANFYGKTKDVLNAAYLTAEDAVNKQTDDLFNNDFTDNPRLSFIAFYGQTEAYATQGRVKSNEALKNFKNMLDNLPENQTGLDQSLNRAEEYLTTIRDFLFRLTEVLNSSTDLSAADLTAYRGYVSTARANILAQVSNINTQEQNIASQKATNQQNIAASQTSLNNAQSALNTAQKELNLKKSVATPEQIQAQEALINQSLAAIENIKAQIEKNSLKSPIGGIVTKQEGKKGETAQANFNIVSIIANADFQVETNITETDVAKVKLGDDARITLDAYGPDAVFETKVSSIDPAETVIEGVATYKTTLQFLQKDSRLKPGLTANIDILTAKKEGVLAVPYRAIISKNSEKSVKVLVGEDKKIEERKVSVGLRGSDGNVEIVEGLKEGDQVITFEKK
ncbi:MAG: efflux RND transporter periplasmic adaptor subunit [Patescibacteria group bacterium]|nr:efflux RND transporter periplasmic adaptor subunit [Patescibacteria group bacterium]